MPLIILTGYPCSGLTYRANQLSTLLENLQNTLFPRSSTPEAEGNPQSQYEKGRYRIHVVASHDASHPRRVYDSARSEKEARAVVYGRVKRLLGKDTIVIVDGMNYIKGWRYQLWCESKAMATTCCVVHVGTPIDQCVENNEARLRRWGKRQIDGQPALIAEKATAASEDSEEPYPPELLQNLIFRYEEPSTSSRWDKPLFTVPWSDPTPPTESIWTALTGQTISNPNLLPSPNLTTASNPSPGPEQNPPPPTSKSIASTTTSPRARLHSRPKITPHQATQQPPTTDPSALYALEKRTSQILTHLRTFTHSHPTISSALAISNNNDNTSTTTPRGISIPIPDISTPLFIPASALAASPTEDLAGAGGPLALPRLQRLRRQWVGMNRAYLGQGHGKAQGSMGAEQVGEAFVRFLNGEFEGGE
ncbi:kti12, chromatin associated [Emydomyces testavorans]|uniref:Kti12, chromatin associated n=1 Tax=Emydomyces testavorans TaxID=2070801 RepID=A0AAF0IJC8_9EURO|nr:kti12, chromatin associated [Emydomyces testavorans]